MRGIIVDLLVGAAVALAILCSGCEPTATGSSDAAPSTSFDPTNMNSDAVTVTSFDPANINNGSLTLDYSDSKKDIPDHVLGQLEGFTFSNVRVIWQGTSLPDGVPVNEIDPNVLVGVDRDEAGAILTEGYEYIFVTYTLTNDHNDKGDFYINSSRIYILNSNLEAVGVSFQPSYLDGRDFTTMDRDIAQEELPMGESKDYTIGYVLGTGFGSDCGMYFVPDMSIGQAEGASVLTYRALKLS
ncbi:MAG: hypothetical protein FWD72_02025 [Eggerthellaceae bacterium]|nr:hypothetical protein [Eggerthellaceae bacterium]